MKQKTLAISKEKGFAKCNRFLWLSVSNAPLFFDNDRRWVYTICRFQNICSISSVYNKTKLAKYFWDAIKFICVLLFVRSFFFYSFLDASFCGPLLYFEKYFQMVFFFSFGLSTSEIYHSSSIVKAFRGKAFNCIQLNYLARLFWLFFFLTNFAIQSPPLPNTIGRKHVVIHGNNKQNKWRMLLKISGPNHGQLPLWDWSGTPSWTYHWCGTK